MWLWLRKYLIIAHCCWFVYPVAKRDSMCLATVRWPVAVPGSPAEDTRHAWRQIICGAMEATECPFDVLGLQPTASLNDVKCAYRTLAKRYHSAKYNSPEAKTIFQKLNKAYHVLANQLCDDNVNRMCDKNNNSESNGDEGNDATLLTNVSIIMRENSFSVTVIY